MTYHIVLPQPMHLGETALQASRHERPRHAMGVLAEALGATVHEPDATPGTPLDRLRAKVAPPVSLWALARRVLAAAGPGDTVFCSSEAGGLQVAALAGRKRPRIAVFVHNVDRPRARFALKAWHMADKVDVFMACSTHQVEFLRRYLGLREDRVRHVWDHTDTRFFTPGPASADKKRPLLVSVGLEQRDYRTLAAATEHLGLDVRISGFSKDAGVKAGTFPDRLPANMSRRFYSWRELLQLYRDADAVVVSCRENRYAAGVQSLMEAMACGRPVIAAATQGLSAFLGEPVVETPPANASAMRSAILGLLADRSQATRRGEHGHALALERYGLDHYVSEVSTALRSLTQ